MFAVVVTGGKQFKVSVNDVFDAEKLEAQVGEKVVLKDVIMLCDATGNLVMDPKGVSIECEVLSQHRGEKLIVFKKRRRHTYKRKKGHRQYITSLKVLSIVI